jgi:[ribosomal protein S18]-alanine N-acetyltransferase
MRSPPPAAVTADRDAGWVSSVRPMVDDDLSVVSAIETRVYRTPWPTSALADHLQSASYRYWVATAAGQVIGYAGLRVGTYALVTTVTVEPSNRSQGVGAALMRELIDWAWGHSVVRLRLEVRATNRQATRLYSKFAFRTVGLRRGYYGSEGDAIIMELARSSDS